VAHKLITISSAFALGDKTIPQPTVGTEGALMKGFIVLAFVFFSTPLLAQNAGAVSPALPPPFQLEDYVCHASKMSGTTPNDAGGKIAAWIALLPSTGGAIDACGIQGDQTIISNFFSGVTIPGDLRVCSTGFLMSSPLYVPSNWAIRGAGESSQFAGVSANLPPIPESGGPSAIIYLPNGSQDVTIKDLHAKGAYSGKATSGITFRVYVGPDARNVQILNNIVTNNGWSGILLKGSQHLVQGNHTEHSAIDGVENFSTDTRIIGNQDYDGAAAANGVGCIEILPGSALVQIIGNACTSSNNQGIVLSRGRNAPDTIVVEANVITNPGAC
jgi:parallel beta-helix repeat protein